MEFDSVDVLLIGAASRSEMQPVCTALFRHVPMGRLQRAPDIPAALNTVAVERWYPHLVVVCQSWPDEFARRDIEHLIGVLPTSRLVCCYGVWCESDGRNRQLWPVAVRVPVRGAAERIRRELEVLRGERMALPVTASRDEAFGFQSEAIDRRVRLDAVKPVPSAPSLGPASTVIQVISPDQALRTWIEELLRSAFGGGALPTIRPVAMPTGLPCSAAVWDLDPWGSPIQDRLRRFRRERPEVPVIGLIGMPLPEDVQQAASHGLCQILAKDAAAERLPEAMEQLLLLRSDVWRGKAVPRSATWPD